MNRPRNGERRCKRIECGSGFKQLSESRDGLRMLDESGSMVTFDKQRKQQIIGVGTFCHACRCCAESPGLWHSVELTLSLVFVALVSTFHAWSCVASKAVLRAAPA